MVSGNLSRFLKGVKPLVLYDVDRRVVMESMKAKLAKREVALRPMAYGHTQFLEK